jgi:CheY-like chemotaxis protein
MVVDDNSDNRGLLAWILEAEDYEPVECSSGEEAITLLKSDSDFCVILMDIQMPGMRGDEALAVIRKDEALNSLPVIAVTAFAIKEQVAHFMECGFVDVLTKPVDEERLLSTLAGLGER